MSCCSALGQIQGNCFQLLACHDGLNHRTLQFCRLCRWCEAHSHERLGAGAQIARWRQLERLALRGDAESYVEGLFARVDYSYKHR